MFPRQILLSFLALAITAVALPQPPELDDAPIVDLGYSVYRGTLNTTTNINIFKGIRYAAPPTGSLRWQPPQDPPADRSAVIDASAFGSQCPQNPLAAPGRLGEEVGELLPVLVWIHGGGYGTGSSADYAIDALISGSGGGFVGVTFNYRLGAFEFLSSAEVLEKGAVNAGILDQNFALQWVQKFIHLFGGNASAVTLSGESAGAGAVMLQTMAYGGTLGESLFTNAIASSPYLPPQHNYNDSIPTEKYRSFADASGCLDPANPSVFDCLVAADTLTLQYASSNVSAAGFYGSWAFLPVTDGTLIRDRPSRQLASGKVNGRRLLTGNNANEGTYFVPRNITTEASLTAYFAALFPGLDPAAILALYPGMATPDDPDAPKYATSGTGPATAVNVSLVATGHQQRAFNAYAEATFICPSYWLAQAFADNGERTIGGKKRKSWKYQYSIPLAFHADDVSAIFGPPATTQGEAFVKAFRGVWASVVRSGSTAEGAEAAGVNWPEFFDVPPPAEGGAGWKMLDLNQTLTGDVTMEAGIQVPSGQGADIAWDLVDGWAWEGGRGARCEVWKHWGLEGLVAL